MQRTIETFHEDPARGAAKAGRRRQLLLGAGLVVLGLAALAAFVWSTWGLDAPHIVARNFRKFALLAGLALTALGADRLAPGALERLEARLRPRRPRRGAAAGSLAGPDADDTELVRREFPRIEAAANELLSLLPDDRIKAAISLAAELAGLCLLRAAGGPGLSKHAPGSMLLAAVADEDYRRANRFLSQWARRNGLTPPGPADIDLPDEDREYYPQVSRLEAPFYMICRRSGLLPEHDVYAALHAAMKIVSAGKKTGLLDERAGQALCLYHLLTGAKVVPYPA